MVPMAPTAGMRLNEGRWMPDRRSGVVIFPKGDNDEWWWRGCETDAGCEGVRKRQEERFEIGSEIVCVFFLKCSVCEFTTDFPGGEYFFFDGGQRMTLCVDIGVCQCVGSCAWRTRVQSFAMVVCQLKYPQDILARTSYITDPLQYILPPFLCSHSTSAHCHHRRPS